MIKAGESADNKSRACHAVLKRKKSMVVQTKQTATTKHLLVWTKLYPRPCQPHSEIWIDQPTEHQQKLQGDLILWTSHELLLVTINPIRSQKCWLFIISFSRSQRVPAEVQ